MIIVIAAYVCTRRSLRLGCKLGSSQQSHAWLASMNAQLLSLLCSHDPRQVKQICTFLSDWIVSGEVATNTVKPTFGVFTYIYIYISSFRASVSCIQPTKGPHIYIYVYYRHYFLHLTQENKPPKNT